MHTFHASAENHAFKGKHEIWEVFLNGLSDDQNVINVHKYRWKPLEFGFHDALKHRRNSGNTEW